MSLPLFPLPCLFHDDKARTERPRGLVVVIGSELAPLTPEQLAAIAAHADLKTWPTVKNAAGAVVGLCSPSTIYSHEKVAKVLAEIFAIEETIEAGIAREEAASAARIAALRQKGQDRTIRSEYLALTRAETPDVAAIKKYEATHAASLARTAS